MQHRPRCTDATPSPLFGAHEEGGVESGGAGGGEEAAEEGHGEGEADGGAEGSRVGGAHAGEEQAEIQKKAQELEKERDAKSTEADHLLHRHHGFANAVAVFQVSIALGAVAALTKNRPVWIGSMLLGAFGLALFLTTILG